MKKLKKNVLIALIISVCLELFLFNFETFRSKFYTPYDKQVNVYYETNFIDTANGYTLSNDQTYSTIEIYDINENINNIYIDFSINGEKQIVETEYYISDEGNKDLYLANSYSSIIWNQNATNSKYTKINAYGKTSRILIKINKENTETLTINSIQLNQQRPLLFSKIRVLSIFLLSFLATLFLGKYNVLNITFENSSKKLKFLCIIVVILIQLVTSLSISVINQDIVNNQSNEQYKMLTDSLIEGHAYLDIETDNNLASLDNPYDVTQRLNNNVSYQFDTAYYKGKYYVYFGVAPVILFYLPYKLITGNYIHDYTINAINFLILSISIIFILYKIISNNYKKTPVLLFAILSIFVVDTCGALALLARPVIYTVPVLCALAFSTLGIALWLYSIKEDETINNAFVFLGSLSIGIAIASRPQFALFAFFAFIIFKDQIKSLSKHIKSFICALIPFVIVGALLMYYNYIRFESPFDFGANYNLTFNDMTKRGFKLDRTLDGIFFYLLQPFSISGMFPYINQVSFATSYIGMLIHEYSYGGLFFINPLTISSLFIYKLRRYIKNKKLLIASIISIIFGLIIVILDTQMAGLVERYFSDFSIYFIFASLVVCLSLVDSNNKQYIYKIMFMLTLFAIIFSFMRLFAQSYESLSLCNPKLYYKVLSLFSF